MRQRWTSDTIRFLRDAAAHSDYYRQLARRAAAYFPPSSRVCDAGCGLGELSLALLPFCRHVTAIDLCPAPIEDLRGRLTEAQRARLTPVCGDIFSHPPEERYDAMVFCLFGSMEEIFAAARAQCRGTVVAVKRERGAHRFTAGSRVFCPADEAEALLVRKNVPYRAERLEAELGQPFRSLEDAARFFRAYNPDAATIPEAELEPGPSPEFPYFLPARRRLRLLAFQTEDIL